MKNILSQPIWQVTSNISAHQTGFEGVDVLLHICIKCLKHADLNSLSANHASSNVNGDIKRTTRCKQCTPWYKIRWPCIIQQMKL